jgi:hypothetical protein
MEGHMSEAIAEAPFVVGDVVELIDQVPSRRELAAGKWGVVVVGDDCDDRGIWNMVTIVLGPDPEGGKAWLIRPRHLRRVAE